MKLSAPQIKALRWLAERGGHACLDKYGRAFAHGEKSSNAAETWLRLFVTGHIGRSHMAGHFGITQDGFAALKGSS